MRLILKLYNVGWYLALPFIMIVLWLKGGRLPAYRQDWGQRFAYHLPQNKIDIWFHAVSVGEVVAATSLIAACLKQGYRVVLTTMTPTGLAQAKQIWGPQIEYQYCPYDFSYAIKGFLKTRQPKALIILETELWPGMLSMVHQHNIPIFLVNARISNRSFGRYLKTKRLWRYLFGFFTAIYAQSEQDRQRFLKIGAQSNQLVVAGNVKFKQHIQAERISAWQQFKLNYPKQRMLVFGSTHAGEEALIVEIYQRLSHEFADLMLVIVPRHPERFDAVYQFLQQQFPADLLQRYSEWNVQTRPALNCLLVDAMGELSSLYAIAECAFVGGSLVNIGGHNILEPIAFDVPVLTGPYMQNQQDLLRMMLEHHAIVYAKTTQDLASGLQKLLSEPQVKQQQILNAKKMLTQYQSAVETCMKGVIEALKTKAPN
jgi:3-deoxy-D-manno-octulosonic-acid transferase